MALIKHSIVATNYLKYTDAVKPLDFLKTLKAGDHLWLVREPANQFDKNAVLVLARDDRYADGRRPVGYVAKVSNNARLASFMDATPDVEFSAIFSYAGTGKSQMPALTIELPDQAADTGAFTDKF